MISEVEAHLEPITGELDQIISQSDVLTSVYLFGSYVRGDFILGKSDLDFAIFLDVPKDNPHWEHPVFLQTSTILRRHLEGIQYLLRDNYAIDLVSFSLHELRNAMNGNEVRYAGPMKLLTSIAFDFLANHRLLSGDPVLKQFKIIPHPETTRQERIEWIRNRHYTKIGQKILPTLLQTLGSLIQYFAVLDGMRDLRKPILREWTMGYTGWPNQVDKEKIFNTYYDYILDETTNSDILGVEWQDETRTLIEILLIDG